MIETKDATRGRSPRPPVRMSADTHAMAKQVAASRGITLADLVDDLIRPVVEWEFRELCNGMTGNGEAGK